MKIDIFNHVMPQAYLELVKQHSKEPGMVKRMTSLRMLWDIEHRVEMLRNVVARDRARLSEDMRHGNRWEIRRDRETLNRHEADLRAALRETGWNNRGAFDSRYSNGYRR